MQMIRNFFVKIFKVIFIGIGALLAAFIFLAAGIHISQTPEERAAVSAEIAATDIAKATAKRKAHAAKQEERAAAAAAKKAKRAEAARIEAARPKPVAFDLLETVDLMGGGRNGSILIAANTPRNIVLVTARKAARNNGLTETDVYCSRVAFRAQYTRSILEANRAEAERCYVAKLRGAHIVHYPFKS